jgi:hypothetical protein
MAIEHLYLLKVMAREEHQKQVEKAVGKKIPHAQRVEQKLNLFPLHFSLQNVIAMEHKFQELLVHYDILMVVG